jgi:hypothetical protein
MLNDDDDDDDAIIAQAGRSGVCMYVCMYVYLYVCMIQSFKRSVF